MIAWIFLNQVYKIVRNFTLIFFLIIKSTSIFSIKIINAFNTTFDQPIFMEEFPIQIKNLPRLFAIVERKGIIYILPQNKEPFKKVILNMKNKICSRGSEEGLLGFTFDPKFNLNNRAYIYYSKCNPRRTILSRIEIKTLIPKNPKRVTELRFRIKEEKLLSIRQPFSNHNGGMIAFGADGYLYIGVGDGGSGGDPYRNGQNLKTLLGKILRIDVSLKKGYIAPIDNPFVYKKQSKIKQEIYAYGLRNPWRFSFDKKNGDLYVGDVGQNRFEEVHLVQHGKNYGWNIMEASHCYRPKRGCRKRGLEMPIFEYKHPVGSCIIGGYVYRGKKIPSLTGKYIFGDTVSGHIWASTPNKKLIYITDKYLIKDSNFYISSFAEDKEGEIYILDLRFGKVLKLLP